MAVARVNAIENLTCDQRKSYGGDEKVDTWVNNLYSTIPHIQMIFYLNQRFIGLF
jgi:hypothetical protein